MNYKDVGIVILAAGKGTRMKSGIAKVLHRVAAKSMVVHVVECAKNIARDNVHVVVGHQAPDVKKEVKKYFKANFSLQKELLGTGDAVKAALPDLSPGVKDVLVLCGDVPLIQELTLRQLIDRHRQACAMITVLATDVDDPTGYGRIILDENDKMHCIKEEADASDSEKKIKKVNTGIYCFDKEFLSSAIIEIKPDNNQAEYYLTDVVEVAQKHGDALAVITMHDPREVIGVNTLEDLEKAQALIQLFPHELP